MILLECHRFVNGNIKVRLENKIELWKRYKEKLLNEENEWSGKLNVEKNEETSERVLVKAATKSLNLMKNKKADKPNNITSELQNMCKHNRVKKLAEVANDLS